MIIVIAFVMYCLSKQPQKPEQPERKKPVRDKSPDKKRIVEEQPI